MQEKEQNKKISFSYFGSSTFSVYVLEELKNNGLVPKVIITTPDKPKGRKLILTETETKTWAKENNVPCLEPKKLDENFIQDFLKYNIDLSIVASYGKIIPEKVLDLPKFKTINVHPSLLPKLRGPSPIQSAILEENETGVSIIYLDKEVDHGPIIKIEKSDTKLPEYADLLEKSLAIQGGKMLCEILPQIISGKIKTIEQDHNSATFTKKIEKRDGKLDLNDSPEINLRKIYAYNTWPTAYYFEEKTNKRVIVKKAHIENNELIIDKVIPEGKKEMSYSDYLRGLK